MKHNTEKATLLISQALKLCNDFSLSSTRSHLYFALQEIKKIDKKRNQRESLNLQMDKQLKQKKEQREIIRKKIVEEQEQKNKIEDSGDIIVPIDFSSDI